MTSRDPEAGVTPRSSMDDVLECYVKDVDRTLLREALKLTPNERVQKLVELMRAADALRDAGTRAFR